MFKLSLDLIDIILALVYSTVILFIAVRIKKKIKNENTKKYFVPFILFKIICAVFFVLIHIYFYGGGDTFLYFSGSNFFANQILLDPVNGVNFLFSGYENLSQFTYDENYKIVNFLKARDVIFLSKLVAPITLICFKQFLTTTIVFSFASSIGIWLIFTTFTKLYPKLVALFAVGILFYPTIGIWGSGILKDPIAISSIGFIFYSTYQLFKRKGIIIPLLLIASSIYVLLTLKPYVLYMLIPTMLLWTHSSISSDLRKGSVLKVIIPPIILLVFIFGGYLFVQQISDDAGKYSLENVETVAKGFHNWHNYLAETRNQSGYDLGEIDYSPLGILKKMPASIFVTYYRPFPFIDTRNVATSFEALQSFILLILTIYSILKVGLFRYLKVLISNKDVRAFMIFALLFGFAVGFTSYNFGALSRYKIPALPFFTASLIIIHHLGVQKKNDLNPKKSF